MCLPYLFILCLERRVEVSQLVSGGKIQLLLRNGSCLLAATGLVCSQQRVWFARTTTSGAGCSGVDPCTTYSPCPLLWRQRGQVVVGSCLLLDYHILRLGTYELGEGTS
jgi:hypothetical protein